jgi:hypothetical protein
VIHKHTYLTAEGPLVLPAFTGIIGLDPKRGLAMPRRKGGGSPPRGNTGMRRGWSQAQTRRERAPWGSEGSGPRPGPNCARRGGPHGSTGALRAHRASAPDARGEDRAHRLARRDLVPPEDPLPSRRRTEGACRGRPPPPCQVALGVREQPRARRTALPPSRKAHPSASRHKSFASKIDGEGAVGARRFGRWAHGLRPATPR